MRLGQLARKYGISKKDIITYLKEKDPKLHSLGQNTKLDEATVELISSRFGDPEQLFDASVTQTSEKQHEVPPPKSLGEAPKTALIQTSDVDLESASQSEQDEESESSSIDTSDEEALSTANTARGEAIETDKLLELLEDEEKEVDLSKITLIKAPKRELEGLKVVGKIELPAPKPKSDQSASAKDGRAKNRNRSDRPVLSEEEREKRRLKAKRKKEAYEARQERRRKEKAKEQRKALNKARYQQKLQQAKANQLKQKRQQPKQEDTAIEAPPSPPKTLLGKLWRWLTTY
jgi:hypothetical protein